MVSLERELAALLARSGYRLREGLILQSGGYTNDVFEAKTDKGDFMVRARNPWALG